jgi:hypothetical protein
MKRKPVILIIFTVFCFLLAAGCSEKSIKTKNESKTDADKNDLNSDSDSFSENDSDSENSDDSESDDQTDIENDNEIPDNFIPENCGNGKKDEGEVCDGNVENCINIDAEKFVSGKAKCLDNCSGYDTATCIEKNIDKICDAGEKKCDGNKVLECSESETEFNEIKTCSGEKPNCYDGECLNECELSAKKQSNTGCEFWGVFLQQGGGYEANAEFAIVVGNPNDTAVTVEIFVSGDELIIEETVPASEILPIILGKDRRVPGAGISDLGFKIVSSRPVTLTQMNPYGDVLVYSNDASLLIPTGALSNEYFVMSWPGWSSLSGFASIIAVEDGETSIEVTYGGDSVAGTQGVEAQTAGTKKTYNLNKYQILTLNSTNGGSNSYGSDLTGTYVSADKKIAVFGGHICSRIPADKTACDHLEHQIFPLQSWGRNYVAARTKPRNVEEDYYKILASTDGTVVTLTGGLTETIELSAGESHLFSTISDFVIESNHPVLIGQFMASQDAGAGTGDPAMMLLVPSNLLKNEYMFIVPPNYTVNNITIIAPADTAITIDETSYDSNNFEQIEGTGWFKHYLKLETGGYTLTASKPVGVYIYGHANYVSYAFTGGMNFSTD